MTRYEVRAFNIRGAPWEGSEGHIGGDGKSAGLHLGFSRRGAHEDKGAPLAPDLTGLGTYAAGQVKRMKRVADLEIWAYVLLLEHILNLDDQLSQTTDLTPTRATDLMPTRTPAPRRHRHSMGLNVGRQGHLGSYHLCTLKHFDALGETRREDQVAESTLKAELVGGGLEISRVTLNFPPTNMS